MYSPMNAPHDVSEELLGVSLAPVDDATDMMGMALHHWKRGDTHVGVDSCHFATLRHLFETWHLFY